MRVLIAAGGTAGHINPALAIAGAIKKADPTAEIHFAGRKEGMEYRLVTQAGYPFHHIEITGFQRKLSLNNIKRNIITLWNLAFSGPKAKKMMKEGNEKVQTIAEKVGFLDPNYFSKQFKRLVGVSPKKFRGRT